MKHLYKDSVYLTFKVMVDQYYFRLGVINNQIKSFHNNSIYIFYYTAEPTVLHITESLCYLLRPVGGAVEQHSEGACTALHNATQTRFQP